MNKWMKLYLASLLATTVSVIGACCNYTYTDENVEYGPENFEGLCKYTFCAYASQQRFCDRFAPSGHEECYDEPYNQACNVHTSGADAQGNCPSPYENPELFEFTAIEYNPVHWDALYGASCNDA